MPPSQQDRIASIATPLGGETLFLSSFSATEELGRLFHYDVILQSEDHQVDFDAVVGENVTIALNLPDESQRYFNGFVSRFSHLPIGGPYANYQMTVVPWLWFLTRTSDCRIFQEKSVPDIIKEVFRDKGMSDFSDELSGNYRPLDYCVQYRETAFNFVSRLMEQEGIYYYFKHENGKHTLVLADAPSAHSPFPGFETILYRNEGSQHIEEEYIYDWRHSVAIQPGQYAHTDFNFEKPKASLKTNSSIRRQHKNAEFEIYDYPGEYGEFGDGESYSKIRIEELQTDQHEISASAKVRGLAVGYKFTLEEHPREDQNSDYLVTSTNYHVSVGEYASGGSGEQTFHCQFSAKKADAPYRSKRVTPKPLISGPQTAFVVGPAGEEIHTDKYGRVKCHFHWDRHGKADDKSSCWIRVSQSWAGKKWGAIYLPRIGQEVVVEFLEGDPDRPIVTGRVYNGDSMPPYDLPANKTMSTLKSNSSKGGKGFNEIRFEDKKGKEQIFIHAERNRDIRVKNDSFEWVGHERHLIVKDKQYELAEKDKHGIVKGDLIEKVDGDENLKVGGDSLTKIGGSASLDIGQDQMVKTGMDHNLKAGMNMNTEAGMDVSRKAGMNIHDKAGMNYGLDAGMAAHIKGGLNVVVEAGLMLTLKAGAGFITIGPTGVSISGPMVLINSGGAAGAGSGSSPKAPAAPQAPAAPKEAKEADTANPGEITQPPKAPKPPKAVQFSPSAQVLQQAARDGAPFCET